MRPDDFIRIEAAFAELVELDPARAPARWRPPAPIGPIFAPRSTRCLPPTTDSGTPTTASTRQPMPMQIGAGTQLGAFRLIEKIGEGGMGAVFRAERADGAFTQEVAAKVMRSAIVDADSKHRFKVERQILASLRHPNIVTLLDGGTTPAGQAYLVMEFVDGTDIIRHCRERSLPLA